MEGHSMKRTELEALCCWWKRGRGEQLQVSDANTLLSRGQRTKAGVLEAQVA